MNQKYLPAALLTAAGLTLSPGHVRAQSSTQVSVDPGSQQDLFLGFEESGNTSNLIVDIGSDAQFLNAAAPFTIQFGVIPTGQTGAGTAVYSLSTDLNSLYSSWTTSSGVAALKWGVIGYDNNLGVDGLVFVSQDASRSVAPTNASYSQAGNISDDVNSLGGTLATDYSTVNSTEAASVSTSSANSWTSFTPSTGGFHTGLNIEQSPGNGPLSTLSLYEEVPDQNGTGKATDLGTLSLGTNGEVTFTPASVPEPSTWLSLIGGALFLGLFRLRRGFRAS